MRLLFVANVCGMDDSRLTIANHSGPTQKKNKKFRFDEFVLSVCRKALPGSVINDISMLEFLLLCLEILLYYKLTRTRVYGFKVRRTNHCTITPQ